MLEEENSVQTVTFAFIIIQGSVDLINVGYQNNAGISKTSE